jgi:hypothetical protein
MRALILLLPSILFFAFFGCIDEPNSVKLETINGIVYDGRGAPVPFIDVASDNFTIFRTSYGGMFMLENVATPYNIFLSTGSDFFTSYLDLKNRNPNLITILGFCRTGKRNLIVHFPQLQPGRALILKFISDQFHEQDEYFFPYSYGTYAWLTIESLQSQPTIKGKLIYLEGNGGSYQIFSYKKFGIKDVILETGEEEVTFTQEDINFDPEEREMTIYSPGNGQLQNNYTKALIYIDNVYNEIELDVDWGPYSYFTVPVLPKLNYDIKIEDQLSGSDWERSTKWIHLQPGEDATIQHDQCPAIISPVNNAAGITDTTVFSVSDNTGPGIYQYSFWLMQDSTFSSFQYDIYTDKKNFSFRDLTKREFKVPPNVKFRWKVYKIPNFNSIDELVSYPYVIDGRYTSLANSKEFKFTTAP